LVSFKVLDDCNGKHKPVTLSCYQIWL